jgi:hypothetical protein
MDVKSIWKLEASLPMKIFLYYNSLSRAIYKIVGVKLHAINIPEQYSHFKAEEICEQIEKRKEHFAFPGIASASEAEGLLPKIEPSNVYLLNSENSEKSD